MTKRINPTINALSTIVIVVIIVVLLLANLIPKLQKQSEEDEPESSEDRICDRGRPQLPLDWSNGDLWRSPRMC